LSETLYRVVHGAAFFLIFAVSSNIAWLNPFPERDSFWGVQSVPFNWQYNRAFGVEIMSAVVVVVWFLTNVLSFVHFPWVHPFDQLARDQAILQNRVELVEQYDLFTDEDRVRAWDGVLVEPGGGK
jgi:uncharacterized PurR-regulated membrane protein YhhQ (DUF165 family)